jgi:SAM-dependent methyltransferase
LAANEWAPKGVDVTTPSVARLYDYYLGGKDNYAVDRAAAEKILTVAPELRLAARENRAFLGRSVRYLTRLGIRQFLDIGTGLPTQGNVHEVAHTLSPESRVAYVDNDPIVLAHSRALLAGGGNIATIRGDLRRPQEILDDPAVRALIDFSEPVALLLVAILHFIPDSADPAGIVATLRDALPPGSHLVLSHGTRDARDAAVAKGTEVYERATAPLVLRTREEIHRLFDGFELTEPGLVWLPQWRPDHDTPVEHPEQALIMAGVGRKN